jgi:hypothetical protein
MVGDLNLFTRFSYNVTTVNIKIWKVASIANIPIQCVVEK